MAAPAVHHASSDSGDRRRTVAARLAQVGLPPAVRRTPPPEGQLGADDYPVTRLRGALAELGPVFATFGRYLSSRLDLLTRREAIELSAIHDAAVPLTAAQVDACVAKQLGAPLERCFFSFDRTACQVTPWTERHRAWLAPGVPVLVTLVRPDAEAWLATDVQLLPLLQPWFDVPPAMMASAIADFSVTLRRRLDQTHQASALATLAADASAHGGFAAPVCYRDHCAPGLLTIEAIAGPTFEDLLADAAESDAAQAAVAGFSRRIVSAWLRQSLMGRVVSYEFEPRDIVVDGDRLVVTGGAFESHSAAERARFLAYLNAVSADDPDAAAAWIVEAAPNGVDREEEGLRRRLRQAVPFRDGEWSGDDRLAEHVLVQWRMARESGCPLPPHHLHLYRGLLALSAIAARLAPHEDALLVALQQWRIDSGLDEAKRLLDPGAVEAALDRLLQGVVFLPQKLDAVLSLAAEGRLHVRLNVPDGESTRTTRNRTVLLVATLVALTALVSVARQMAPALGPGVERLAAVALLVLGGWLLVVAARM